MIQTTPLLFFVPAFALACLYAALMLFYTAGWLRVRKYNAAGIPPSVSLSIIIPARNESGTIENSLSDLVNQDYPADKMQILVVDDDSQDDTVARVEAFIAAHQGFSIELIRLDNESRSNAFKKEAIVRGIGRSRADLIVTTDADCRMPRRWLSTIAAYYHEHSPKMICSPVCFTGERSFFERVQSLEFIGLIAVGAAGISLRKPIMCNGANLAYERAVFAELEGFKGSEHIASGDDTFLMFKIAEKYPEGVHFLKSMDACVTTSPRENVREFLQQRMRWASKTKHYKNADVKVVALIVYFFNLFVFAALVLAAWRPSLLWPVLLLLLVKVIADFIFLYSPVVFFKRKKLFQLFLPEQFLYLLYVLIVGSVAPFAGYRWKGRSFKP